MNVEDIPWIVVLPALVAIAFGIGLAYKKAQDKGVEFVRHTLRPGDFNASDLEKYREQAHGKQS